MSLRVLLALWIAGGLNAVAPPPPNTTLAVEFRFDRVPRHLWARELVWLKNMGVPAIAVTGLTPEASSLTAQAGLTIIPESDVTGMRISVLGANALVRSRKELLAARPVVWTDVESETAPFFHRGAVALSGDEDASLQSLRREANVLRYWSPVLESKQTFSVPNHLPDTIHLVQKAIAEASPGASAVSVANSGKTAWTGELHVTLPSYKRAIQIPGVTIPAQDALLLPVDVAFSDPRFCRFCSGMSNSERLLYATEELTAIEYENGILSFEFYAPNAGVAVLQLEREPAGPMLAAGHPIAFDWDAENKRARLPIPAGRAANKRVRIAVTMTGPDDVASFVDTRALMIGQTNHILTDYSSEDFAKRSRLILPEVWKATAEVKSPLQVAYAIDVPPACLHGEYADLRLEADGVGMSHVRLQLLRPVSVHAAEASVLHFGTMAELISDPPVVPVDGPNGRTFTIQLRNNAPEIRTFQVAVAGDGMEFSPAAAEISIGPSMERDVSVREFSHGLMPGLHDTTVHIRGAAEYAAAVRFVVIPRGEAVTYSADLADTGRAQTVWENAHIRAVFSEADGGRWIEFYWKESGKSFLPPEGVALAKPVKVELQGDVLTIDGARGLPAGGKIGDVEWKADVQGSVTRYRVTEKTGGG